MKLEDSSPTSMTHIGLIWVTLSDFLQISPEIGQEAWIIRKITEVRIRQEKMPKGLLFFSDLYYLMTFGKISFKTV
jgi:hypothetical protein